MKRPLISVIIPVHNVEKYLSKCLNSLVNQTYKELDIILVDDGSKDNSSIICDEYQKMDSRIRVIHKEYGGVSDARNKGISSAEGKYITFVDSDDYVTCDYIETLFKLLHKYKADISACGCIKVKEGEEVAQKGLSHTKEISFSNSEGMQDLFYQRHLENSAWGKLYKYELFSGIEYPVGRVYEDLGTTYKLIYRANKIVWTSQAKYFYLQRANSIMHKKYSSTNMDRVFLSEEIVDFVKKNIPSIEEASILRAFISNIQVLREIPLRDSKYSDELGVVKENIKKYRNRVIKDSNAKGLHRLIALSTYIPLSWVQQLGKVYKKKYK